MGENTGIQWTEATWNPIRGCSRVSPGCMNCYAEKEAKRFSGKETDPYFGLLDEKGRWNGTILLVPNHYEDPLRWQRPRLIFVNSMSDLFHEKVSFEFIAGIFGIMAAASHHTFQVLTKRPERMVEFFQWLDARSDLGTRMENGMDPRLFWCFHHARHTLDVAIYSREAPKPSQVSRNIPADTAWPLPNVWLGTSVENQKTADTRIPYLSEVPAAVRWLSMEPLLGPVGLSALPVNYEWVVVGGESGPNSRVCQGEWLREIIGHCQTQKIPCFVKQLGAAYEDPLNAEVGPKTVVPDDVGRVRVLKHPKCGDIAEWLPLYQVREWPVR